MNDPENFLSRWSRRKSEDKHETVEPPKPAGESASGPPPQGEGAEPAAGRAHDSSDAKPVVGPPDFDLASLPPIDSIGPQTDVSGFLQPGVPTELRHAALRRAWSVDPAIRDFRGLQENDWDFNDPNGIPGFGPLPADFDVKQMVSALFGEKKPADDSTQIAERQTAQLTSKSDFSADAGTPTDASAPHANTDAETASEAGHVISHIAPEQTEFVQREENGALQDKDEDKSESKLGKPRRTHGGALPD